MTPPTTRTWSRRGHTPVIRVPGRSRRRSSVAALACYKAGEPSRLIYRPCPNTRPDGRKSFSWKDYRDPIQTAHQQLGGPYRAGLGQLERPTGALQARSRAEPLQRTVHRTGAAYGPAEIAPLLGQAGGGRARPCPALHPPPQCRGEASSHPRPLGLRQPRRQRLLEREYSPAPRTMAVYRPSNSSSWRSSPWTRTCRGTRSEVVARCCSCASRSVAATGSPSSPARYLPRSRRDHVWSGGRPSIAPTGSWHSASGQAGVICRKGLMNCCLTVCSHC